MTKSVPFLSIAVALAVLLGTAGTPPAWAQAPTGAAATASGRVGDHIVAIVGSELVTAVEVERRMQMVRAEARQSGQAVPPDTLLHKRTLDALIDERVVLVHARDSGVRVDEPDIDRAVQAVAQQNKLTVTQLRDQLRKEGLDYGRFRAQLRDQIMIERIRERDVMPRIKVTDTEIDDFMARQKGSALRAQAEYNIAQILISVPERADAATVERLRAKAEQQLKRVQSRENFAVVAREVSEDTNRSEGGEIGLKPASRLPDSFVTAVRNLRVGEVSGTVLQTDAGFHVLKLIEKREAQDLTVVHTRARHILMRPSSQTPQETIQRQMLEMKRQVDSGLRKFEDLARVHSIDGSADQGGDLGFAAPGSYVPEFEAAMAALRVGAVSAPVVTRFGVHLIQVVERKDVRVDPRQLREQARNELREQRFEQAYTDWVRELRGRAYIELREAP